MKTVTIRDLQKKLKESVDAAQSDRVVITRQGKPAAVLVGVEGADWETVVLETNAAFWRLIEKRRRQPTVSLTEMRKRLRKAS
ncbi:MAG: type II toxin-antitoxin system Phd/YefM family antitoxin [Nitrospirae bacterium]|nr:type II toxin-antitoxin system Phd/YefM family antitoxin [Nitrospirota bacterium]